MKFDWNINKATANLIKHKVSFDTVYDLDWDTVIEVVDTRFDYGETRWVAYGMIGNRLHVLVYTRRGDTIWIIGLRKANERERKRYDKQT